jgi:hypothetical protein
MYRANRQPELPDFHLPFGGKLDPGNRWVKLAKIVPWHLVEEDYRANFADSGMHPAATFLTRSQQYPHSHRQAVAIHQAQPCHPANLFGVHFNEATRIAVIAQLCSRQPHAKRQTPASSFLISHADRSFR